MRALSPRRSGPVWGTLFFVWGATFLLAASAATDIPFHDAWNNEGQWLYPSWLENRLQLLDLFRPIGEHRSTWTCLLDLALFSINGQWDPLVQIFVLCVLRAACAGGVVYQLCAAFSRAGQWGCVVLVTVAFLPHLAWQTVLWGVNSTDFAVGFSWLCFALLGEDKLSLRRTAAGVAAGLGALLSMASGYLVPVALFGLLVIRLVERGRFRLSIWTELAPFLGLLMMAAFLHTEGNPELGFRSRSIGEFLTASARALAWPHVGTPAASLVVNLPIVCLIGGRLWGKRKPAPGENFVTLIWGWSAAIAFAIGWARGGGPELEVGVPSRYVDFFDWCAFGECVVTGDSCASLCG